MGEVGFEPTLLTKEGLESSALTTRPSALEYDNEEIWTLALSEHLISSQAP